MPLHLTDRKIDKELEKIVANLRDLGIVASKTDAIRWILNIKRQGKKTNKKWCKIL